MYVNFKRVKVYHTCYYNNIVSNFSTCRVQRIYTPAGICVAYMHIHTYAHRDVVFTSSPCHGPSPVHCTPSSSTRGFSRISYYYYAVVNLKDKVKGGTGGRLAGGGVECRWWASGRRQSC